MYKKLNMHRDELAGKMMCTPKSEFLLQESKK